MPSLSLYFDEKFPDERWIKVTHALEIPAKNSGEFVLGRSPAADLTFDIKSMSVRHAVIAYSYARDSWTIDDLGSTNGILLRGKKVTPKKPEPLNIGDTFWLGPEAKFYCVENEQDTTSLSLDEAGPSTVASTTPLATLPPATIASTTPLDPLPAPPAPAPAPASKTPWDSVYLGTQWVISGQTPAGKVYRLIVAGAAVTIFIFLLDWLTQ